MKTTYLLILTIIFSLLAVSTYAEENDTNETETNETIINETTVNETESPITPKTIERTHSYHGNGYRWIVTTLAIDAQSGNLIIRYAYCHFKTGDCSPTTSRKELAEYTCDINTLGAPTQCRYGYMNRYKAKAS